MIDFNKSNEQFIIDDLTIGLGTTFAEVAKALSGRGTDVVGSPDWKQIFVDSASISYSLSFRDGVLHSGYFWAHVRSDSDGWDDADRTEYARRQLHERLMRDWVGADRFFGLRISYIWCAIRDPISKKYFSKLNPDRQTK